MPQLTYSFLRIVLVMVGICFGGALVAAPTNVVIVISDDQGYGDLGCTGNPIIKTPHIDQLASESSGFSCRWRRMAIHCG